MIAYTEQELTQRVGPLVYGVADRDGVTRAIVRLMQEYGTALVMDYIEQTGDTSAST